MVTNNIPNKTNNVENWSCHQDNRIYYEKFSHTKSFGGRSIISSSRSKLFLQTHVILMKNLENPSHFRYFEKLELLSGEQKREEVLSVETRAIYEVTTENSRTRKQMRVCQKVVVACFRFLLLKMLIRVATRIAEMQEEIFSRYYKKSSDQKTSYY